MKNGIWVIGDVHGEYDKLIRLINKLPKNVNIYFTGDLIDRGDSSSKVLDLVIDNNWSSVLGNHEQMMIKAVKNPEIYKNWLMCGGAETIDSYKDKAIYPSHYKWLESLSYFYHLEIDGYKPLVISHSYIHNDWVDKEYKYSSYDGKDILWRHMHNKNFFNEEKEIENNIFNIFGHTYISKPIVTDAYAMIDTGATYEKYGTLSAIHYPTLEIIETK